MTRQISLGKLCACALALWAVVGVAVGAGLSSKNTLADLEGKWTLVKAEMDGKPLLGGNQPSPEITISQGRLTSDFKLAPKDPVDLIKILDPSATPKAITVPVQRRIVFYGIYEVQGSELHICGDAGRAGRAAGQRPKDFNAPPIEFVFKRMN